MPNISAKDLEVVRLTAMFVASKGRQWMTQLSQRETGNYQFDFLRPNHSLHNFFQRLVDQYTVLLKAGGMDGNGGKEQQQRIAELERNIRDKFHVLARAKQRAEWLKFQETQKAKKEEEAEKEKLSYAQIDWHDFVVVETVLFTEADDQAQLPPPQSLSDLQFASLEQKAQMSINHNLRIEEGFPSEEDSYSSTYAAQQAAAAPQAQQMPPPQPAQPAQPVYAPQYSPQAPAIRPRRSEQEEEEEARIRERTEARERAQEAQAKAKAPAGPGQMKIKENYVPRAAQRMQNQKQQMALCPNCGQQIPYSELDEHMRSKLFSSPLLHGILHSFECQTTMLLPSHTLSRSLN